MVVGSQGPWGSTYIDDYFRAFLGDLIDGLDKLSEPQLDHIMSGWEKLKVFTAAACCVAEPWPRDSEFFFTQTEFTGRGSRMTLDIAPPPAGAPAVDWARCVASYNAANGLAAGNALAFNARFSRLQLSEEIVRRIHAPIVDQIVGHARGLLHRDPPVGFTHMLIVGGFARSSILFDALRTLGEAKGITVVLSSKPAIAVVCGAVRYGLNPAVITHRAPRFTLGIRVRSPFRTGDPVAERVDATESDEDKTPRILYVAMLVVSHSLLLRCQSQNARRMQHL